MKKRLMILITSFITILATLLALKSYAISRNQHIIDNIAGVIRNDGQGWDLILDEGHTSIGISKIETNDNFITIIYDKTYEKVVTFSATVDETMASEGYTVGASVGLDKAYIYVYKNNKLTKPKDYFNCYGNIWLHGLFKESKK